MGRFHLSLLVFGAAAVAVAAPAFAADLPAAPAYNPPPVYLPHIYNWTGFYFGGHVGAGVLEDSVTQTTTSSLFNAGSQTHVNAFSVLGGASSASTTSSRRGSSGSRARSPLPTCQGRTMLRHC